MKRISNFFFYLSGCFILLNAIYLFFHGEKYEWQDRIMGVFFIIAVAAYTMNCVDRYMAIRTIRDKKNKLGYTKKIPLGARFAAWRRMTFGGSILFGIVCGGFMIIATPESFATGILVFISGIERLFYLLLCKQKNYFLLSFTKNSIIVNNGGLTLLSLNKLSLVEPKYDELLFIYKNGEVKSLFYPVSESPYQEEFVSTLKKIATEKGFGLKL